MICQVFQNIMKKHHIGILIIFLYTNTLFSQIKAIVLDSITKDPIPYVNIWVQDWNLGTMSNTDGSFKLGSFNGTKTIVFSAVGYITKKIASNQITNTIQLKPQITYLEEAIVLATSKRKKLTQKVGKIQHSKLGFYLPGFKEQWIFAKYYRYHPDYKKTPYLNEVRIATHSDMEDAKFILKLYTVNSKGEPEGYLFKDNIIVTAPKGKKVTKINLQALKIAFPKEGFFIAVEWIPFQKYRRMWGAIQPEIGFMQLETQKDSWYYRYGRWNRIWKLTELEKYRNKYNHLALELVLNN